MSEWLAYHGKSSSEHQSEFNDLSGRGFRMISLSVFGNPLSPRYAAVWVRRLGPAFIAFHGKTAAEYQQLSDRHTADGFRPTILCATGGGVRPTVFAGVFEQGNWDFFALYNAGAAEFQQQSDNLRNSGFAMRWLSVYGDVLNPLYAGVWGANTRSVAWSLELGDDGNWYQKKFDAYTAGRMRPECVSVAGTDRYAAIWYDDLIGDWHSFHGMNASAYQQKFDEMKARGFMPIRVQAGGPWNDPRYAAVFARDDQIPTRQWTMRGPETLGPVNQFDRVVRDFMVANGIRAAQLAVARHGKLVYVRAFTHAEPGYPITEITTPFRIASVSKTLTATAMFTLIEQGRLSLNNRMQDILHLQTPSGGAPTDPDFANILVWHLLSHCSGLDDSDQRIRSERNVARAFGPPPLPLPITRNHLASFAATRPVTSPGTGPWNYNSLAYFLLGQIVTAKAGSYDQFVRERVFAPLGITRASVAKSLLHDALPGEVSYDLPGIGNSVMSADEPLVPNAYGTWDVALGAAMGGWVLAAADYARFWVSFDIGAHNPVLRPQTVQRMWTSPPVLGDASVLHGWWLQDVDGVVAAIGHNGGFGGTACTVGRRSDGISFVVIFNHDVTSDFFRNKPFGQAMNDAIHAVNTSTTGWPTVDLFPHVGLKTICDDGWRWCNRCQVLFRVGGKSTASCPAGAGGHSATGSAHYTLVYDLPTAPGQWGWRRCQNCEALWFADAGAPGACPADASLHHRAGQIDYVLALNEPSTSPGQRNWHWCSRCQSLWYAGNGTSGQCAAGPGGHSTAGSGTYLLLRF